MTRVACLTAAGLGIVQLRRRYPSAGGGAPAAELLLRFFSERQSLSTASATRRRGGCTTDSIDTLHKANCSPPCRFIESNGLGDRCACARRGRDGWTGPLLTVFALVAALTLSAVGTAAADPLVAGSASASCSSTEARSEAYTIAPTGRDLNPAVARITTDGPIQFWYPPGPTPASADGSRGPGLGFNFPIAGPGTYWNVAAPVPASSPAYGSISCPFGSVSANAIIDVAQMPGVPADYAGTAAPAGVSYQYFAAPGEGRYQAQIAVTQGALRSTIRLPDNDFSTSVPPPQTITTAGTMTFEVGRGGPAAVVGEGLDGPPVRWAMRISALPVQVAGPKVTPVAARPGQRATITYTIDYPVVLDAAIIDSAGEIVRPLATSLPVKTGSHTLFFDGLRADGVTVADGHYTVSMLLRDNTSEPTVKTAVVTLDGRRPTIRAYRTSRRLTRLRPVVFSVRDSTSGIRRARLMVNGRTVDRLAKGEQKLLYRPSGGWRRGRAHAVKVIAEDRAGNVSTLRRTVRVR